MLSFMMFSTTFIVRLKMESLSGFTDLVVSITNTSYTSSFSRTLGISIRKIWVTVTTSRQGSSTGTVILAHLTTTTETAGILRIRITITSGSQTLTVVSTSFSSLAVLISWFSGEALA